MKNIACVDVGSNSIVLSVCEYRNNQMVEKKHMSFITKLGKNLVANKCFSEESIDLTTAAFKTIKTTLNEFAVSSSDLFLVATEASRVATNKNKLFNKIRDIVGVEPELISGDEEARLCLLGQKFLNTALSELTLVDIGGASTEVICGELSDNFVKERYINSFKTGVVKLKDLGSIDEVKKTLEEVFFDLEDDFFQGRKVFFSAGTMTTFASMLNVFSNEFR